MVAPAGRPFTKLKTWGVQPRLNGLSPGCTLTHRAPLTSPGGKICFECNEITTSAAATRCHSVASETGVAEACRTALSGLVHQSHSCADNSGLAAINSLVASTRNGWSDTTATLFELIKTSSGATTHEFGR